MLLSPADERGYNDLQLCCCCCCCCCKGGEVGSPLLLSHSLANEITPKRVHKWACWTYQYYFYFSPSLPLPSRTKNFQRWLICRAVQWPPDTLLVTSCMVSSLFQPKWYVLATQGLPAQQGMVGYQDVQADVLHRL